jgi:hypothetical protein
MCNIAVRNILENYGYIKFDRLKSANSQREIILETAEGPNKSRVPYERFDLNIPTEIITSNIITTKEMSTQTINNIDTMYYNYKIDNLVTPSATVIINNQNEIQTDSDLNLSNINTLPKDNLIDHKNKDEIIKILNLVFPSPKDRNIILQTLLINKEIE